MPNRHLNTISGHEIEIFCKDHNQCEVWLAKILKCENASRTFNKEKAV